MLLFLYFYCFITYRLDQFSQTTAVTTGVTPNKNAPDNLNGQFECYETDQIIIKENQAGSAN